MVSYPFPSSNQPNHYSTHENDIKNKTQSINIHNNFFDAQKRYIKHQEEIKSLHDELSIQNYLRSIPTQYIPSIDYPRSPLLIDDIFSKNTSDFLKNLSTTLAVPIEIATVCMLSTVCTATRGRVSVRLSSLHKEVLTEYFLISAPSDSRKDNTAHFFRNTLLKAHESMVPDKKILNSNTFREIIKRMSSKRKKMIENEIEKNISQDCDIVAEILKQKNAIELIEKTSSCAHQIKLIIDTPTATSLIRALNTQDEFICIFDVEGRFLEKIKHENIQNIIIKSYDAESYLGGSDIKLNVDLNSPITSMCLLTNPEIYQDFYQDENIMRSDISSRFLPIFLGQSFIEKNLSEDISEEIQEWLQKKIRSIMSVERPRSDNSEKIFNEIILSTEAKEYFSYFRGRNDVEAFVSGKNYAHRAFKNRKPSHLIRLAGILHILENDQFIDNEISAKTIKSADILLKFFDVYAQSAFDNQYQKSLNVANKILNWIYRHKKSSFEERDAQRGVGRCTIEEIRSGIDILETNLYLGRLHLKNLKFVVNPNLITQTNLISPNPNIGSSGIDYS
ncbi:hypothetical protein GCM10011497_20060 [Elstera cyanobacteriorum]|uniref:DUF3987 domain-containing protein n=1 Tax=Elstera cyanobacteriorum TaxID=2022747 RepID=A0A255XS90_9PROT|nr:DUF3987 domain-containing protein [Elstera cyanobacteriorum]OYQ19295.1 hypothetical protein CHR90_07605 [Elstera cyanobacteriorum]GFZ90456.1 hypothetical protein GCM10011497_20060 [Elstera cyanobacteriorum]